MSISEVVAYYKLDAANILADATGRGNDLTNVNSTPTAAGKVAEAASFNGGVNNRALERASGADAREVGDIYWYCSFWFNVSSVGDNQALVGVWDGGATWMVYKALNKLDFYYTSALSIQHTITLSTGTWYFVEVWYDPAANLAGINVNRGTDFTVFLSGGIVNGGGKLVLGRLSSGNSNVTGEIDELGIWKPTGSLLTSTERDQIYNSGNGATYPFDAASSRNFMLMGVGN